MKGTGRRRDAGAGSLSCFRVGRLRRDQPRRRPCSQMQPDAAEVFLVLVQYAAAVLGTCWGGERSGTA